MLDTETQLSQGPSVKMVLAPLCSAHIQCSLLFVAPPTSLLPPLPHSSYSITLFSLNRGNLRSPGEVGNSAHGHVYPKQVLSAGPLYISLGDQDFGSECPNFFSVLTLSNLSLEAMNTKP